MFCLDKKKDFTFSISNILALLRNFEVLSSKQSMDKIVQSSYGLLNFSIKNSDEDMLELCKFLSARAYFEENSELCIYI